jgi:RimJ/RimL family protein N-acetyltransferase
VSALAGEGFVLRRATDADLAFMVELATSPDVEPAMSASAARDEDAFRAELERSQAEPESFGRFVLEVDGRPAGLFAFAVENRRSRIAHLFGVMLHPDFRGRGLADAGARLLVRHLVFDLDYHRVQLEVYGFNEAGLRHAERAGFVREGVKRRAYRRHDRWVDGVLFAVTREDLE